MTCSYDATCLVLYQHSAHVGDLKVSLLSHDVGHLRVLGEGQDLCDGVLSDGARRVTGNPSNPDASICDWFRLVNTVV